MVNHKTISYIKSGLRIFSLVLGSILVPMNMVAGFTAFFVGFTLAEVLGILEEVFDRRKE